MRSPLLLLVASGCMMASEAPPMPDMVQAAPAEMVESEEEPAGNAERRYAKKADSIAENAGVLGQLKDMDGAFGGSLGGLKGASGLGARGSGLGGGGFADDSNAEPAARMREWFPEAFVWRPSLQTDGDGVASVDLRVPDQLTTWRLLALAHDANGHQSGSEHSFDSALPVSVEPLVPGWLYAGDRVVLYGRAQALGTSASGEVVVSASEALAGGGRGRVTLGPGASGLVDARLVAERSGTGLVKAEIFGPQRLDGAERAVVVHPTGRRITTQRGGLVPQTVGMLNGDATEERVSVRVFPGPLALFQAELERLEGRPSAVSYAVLQGVRALSATSGIEVDEDRLRTVRLKAWQRLVKQARSPSASTAAQLLYGLGTPDDGLASTLKERLVRTTVAGQRGDGTWSANERSTAQRVLVETAMAARSLPEDQEGPRLRASGALERLLPNVDDPYTAAWLLASGVLDAGSRPLLQEKVLAGIQERDGVHTLVVPSGVVDVNGRRPARAEALAVAVLALHDRDDLPWKGELVAELLQGWDASRGFGAGWADALALEAIALALPALDAPVTVTLSVNGDPVGSGTLDPKQPSVPVVLEAGEGGRIEVTAEPAVPGLSFAMTHQAWVPFTGKERVPGVDLEVSSTRLVAGQEGALVFELAAPSGAVVELKQGLVAGTEVDDPVGAASFEVEPDHVSLKTRRFGAGEVMTLRIPVTPQYAGTFRTAPLEVTTSEGTFQLAPHVWTVGR